MVDIVGINNTTQQANKIADRSASKSAASKSKEATVAPSTGDRIEISAGVKEAQAVKRLVAAAQSEPDVRPEAVATAKERLQNGEYNGVEASRTAAKKILGMF